MRSRSDRPRRILPDNESALEVARVFLGVYHSYTSFVTGSSILSFIFLFASEIPLWHLRSMNHVKGSESRQDYHRLFPTRVPVLACDVLRTSCESLLINCQFVTTVQWGRCPILVSHREDFLPAGHMKMLIVASIQIFKCHYFFTEGSISDIALSIVVVNRAAIWTLCSVCGIVPLVLWILVMTWTRSDNW